MFRVRSKEDKRKVHAYLTDQAVETLKEAPIPLQDHFAREFSGLKVWEQTMIIASLQRIAHMMDAQDIDASPVLDVGLLDRQDMAVDQPLSSQQAVSFQDTNNEKPEVR